MTASPRSRVVLALLVALVSATVALGSAPASAAFGETAVLQLKGTGSAFSGDGSTAALAVPAGGTALYTVKVVNTGPIAARFQLIPYGDGVYSMTTTTGGTLTPAIGFGYITPVIKPGASFSATTKVKTLDQTQRTYVTHVQLYDVAPASSVPTLFGEVTLRTEVRAPLTGGTGMQLFGRNGGLSFVGGSVSGQTAGGPALKVGSTSTFTIRVHNVNTPPDQYFARITGGCSAYSYTVKLGKVDQTAAWRDGFLAPPLAKGANRDYTVTVKRVAADPGCTDPGLVVRTTDVSVNLGVPGAV